MDSERYHLIKRLFQDAFERESADRLAFLEAACGGDSQLRDEVAALLELDEREGAAEGVLLADGGRVANLPLDSETRSHKNRHDACTTAAARFDRRRWTLPTVGGVTLVGVVITYLIYQSADRTRHPTNVQPVTDAAVTSDSPRVALSGTPGSDATSDRLRTEPESHSDLFLAQDFGNPLNSMSHIDNTEPEAKRRLADSRRTLGDAHPATLLAIHDLAKLLLQLDRGQESEALCNEAVQLAGQHLSALHPFRLAAVAQHGRALMVLGRYEDAERALFEAYEGYVETRGPDDKRVREVAGMLSEMYAEWHVVEPAQGHGDKSAHWRKRTSVSTDLTPSES